MTYYRILKYLKANGLDDSKAHYVRNMIRELVRESVDEDRNVNPNVDGTPAEYPTMQEVC